MNSKIKNELITLYKPVIYDDNDFVILKLSSKPDIEKQSEAVNIIKKKFGLDIKYIKVANNENKGINEITFYKNKKLFKELKVFYIYWDVSIRAENYTELINNEKKNNSIKKDDHENIESEKRNIKREKLIFPDSKKFKYSRYQKSDNYDKIAKIAIIIDDLGYSYNSTYDFLTLGFPITFSYIPEAENNKKIYNLFKHFGYDILLHLPMEPLKGKQYVEKNAIFTDMTDNEIDKRINSFFSEYPDVIGVNNHMGSRAVNDPRVMNIVFKNLKKKDLFWLDSKTTLNSISKDIAEIHELEYFMRDVFLDNENNEKTIREYMDKLVSRAKKNGYAIGIGHIQSAKLVPVLIDYYNNKEKLGIEFVSIKDLQTE